MIWSNLVVATDHLALSSKWVKQHVQDLTCIPWRSEPHCRSGRAHTLHSTPPGRTTPLSQNSFDCAASVICPPLKCSGIYTTISDIELNKKPTTLSIIYLCTKLLLQINNNNYRMLQKHRYLTRHHFIYLYLPWAVEDRQRDMSSGGQEKSHEQQRTGKEPWAAEDRKRAMSSRGQE